MRKWRHLLVRVTKLLLAVVRSEPRHVGCGVYVCNTHACGHKPCVFSSSTLVIYLLAQRASLRTFGIHSNMESTHFKGAVEIKMIAWFFDLRLKKSWIKKNYVKVSFICLWRILNPTTLRETHLRSSDLVELISLSRWYLCLGMSPHSDWARVPGSLPSQPLSLLYVHHLSTRVTPQAASVLLQK